jgi:hypothetical protein
MRIVMPLFQFEYLDSKPFHFSGKQLRIEKFNADEETPKIDLFSKHDTNHIAMVSRALIFDHDDTKGYRSNVNLLLLSFRIFSKGKPPFIKYRLCKGDIRECSRLNSTMTYIHEFEKNKLSYSKEDLIAIDAGFQGLLEMYGISPRCHNALYFLYLGFHTIHWIESFMFLMNTLEAIFSKDKSGGATQIICTRISSFLKSKRVCKYDDINHLYDIRSRIVHGNIVIKNDPNKNNLKELHHLQYIVIECMKKIIQEKIYLKFIDAETRNSYLSTLNVSI